MSSDTNSLAHTKWNCKHHIVFAPKYIRQVIVRNIFTYSFMCNGIARKSGKIIG